MGLSLLVANMRWPSINAFDRAFSFVFVSISLGYYDAASMKASGYLTCLLFLVLLLCLLSFYFFVHLFLVRSERVSVCFSVVFLNGQFWSTLSIFVRVSSYSFPLAQMFVLF